MQSEDTQIKAVISRDLKRKAFAAFALNGQKFSGWVRTELEKYIHAAKENPHEVRHADED